MMRFKAFAIVAMAALCVADGAAAAGAYKFSPPSTAFTASGQSFLTKGTTRYICGTTVQMRTNAKGRLKINSVSFSGDNCPQALGLPWRVVSAGFNSAFFKKVSMTTPFGSCNAASFPIFLTGGTMLWSWSFADCGAAISASLQTSPTLSLVPK